MDYRRLKKFNLLTVDSTVKLVSRVKSNIANGEVKYFVHNSEMFDILKKAHINTGHGGFHKMTKNLNEKYCNVSRNVILLFIKNCESCTKKKAHPKKGVVVKPIISKDVYARAQVDLIDLQSCKDGNYKFIMNYQDHLTKYSVLRALRTKTAEEVAFNLIDIFSLFGAPTILQSDNGREFVNSIINELQSMWPGLKIIHGKPRHSQSQGSVERSNRDIGEMVRAWMVDNETKNWSQGLRFCQFQKNTSLHSAIKQSPFEAMFGHVAKIGLSSSNLPNSVIESINSEEDLLQILKNDESETEKENDEESEVEVSSENEEESIRLKRAKIQENQQSAIEGLEKQAKRMLFESNNKFPPLERGMCVTIPIPDFDRSKADFRNHIGVVMEVVNDMYKIGTREGLLPQLYSRNQISLSSTNFLSVDEVPSTTTSLRAANSQSSIVGGQGFVQCNCLTKCQNNRCMCKKQNVLCL